MTAPAGTRYVMAPQWLFRSGVSGAAVLTWGALASRGRWDDGAGGYVDIWPSIDTITADTGLSESTVRRSIRELIARGLLEVEQRRAGQRQATNRYRALVGQPPYHNGRDEASQPVTDDTLRTSQPVTGDRNPPQPVTHDGVVAPQPVTGDGGRADSTAVDAPRCPDGEVLRVSDLAPEEEPLPLPVVDSAPAQTEDHPELTDGRDPLPPPVGDDLSSATHVQPPAVDVAEAVVDLTAPPTRQDQLAPQLVGFQAEIAQAYARHGLIIDEANVRAVHRWLRSAPNVSNVAAAFAWYATRLDRLTELLRRARTLDMATRHREGDPCPHGEPGGVVPNPSGGFMRCPLCRLGAAAQEAAAVQPEPADRVVQVWAKAADMARPENRFRLGLILRQAQGLLVRGLDVDTLVTIAGEAGKRSIDLVSYADRVLKYTATQGGTHA